MAVSHPVADSSRSPSRNEKLDFLRVCREVCPGFRVSEALKPVMNSLLRWCLMLDGPLVPEKGLWLWGSIGSGKSAMLEIVKRYCFLVRPAKAYREVLNPKSLRQDRWKYSFRITNASEVAGAFAKDGYPGLETYILEPRQAFDEVGRECIPTGYFGNMENVFQYIIQRRYDLRYNDFTHVTSNLHRDQIPEVYGEHIADRCNEMFNFVEISGESWR